MDLEQTLSEFNNLKQDKLIKANKLHIKYTTNIDDFQSLGMNYADNGSCFGDDSQNSIHKYILAARKDTFVVYISTSKTFETAAGRCWGWLIPNLGFCYSNFYFKESVNKETFIDHITNCSKELLKNEKVKADKSNKRRMTVDNILYVNGDALTVGTDELADVRLEKNKDFEAFKKVRE